MTGENDGDIKKKSFHCGDFLWLLLFVVLAIVLIFTGIYLWETWKISALKGQFFRL